MSDKFFLLQPLVEYGTIEYDGDDEDTPCQSVWYCAQTEQKLNYVPDGCEELIFLWQRGKAVCTRLQKNERVCVDSAGMRIHGVRLEPGYYFDLNSSEISLMEKELGRIFEEEDRQIYIRTRLEGKIIRRQLHPAVNYMLSAIRETAGRISVDEMAKQLGYTTRHINSLFTQTMGYGPKSFCRYVRFQSSLYEILLDPFRNNSQFIENQSYSDQAHFQREFKYFMGMTPRQFIAGYLY